jgi:MinD superfamily P-loop ATPase
MIITVASGKGGTGKTTIATSLAYVLADLSPVVLDCDVEAPNAHLFLEPKLDARRDVSIPVPAVDESHCTACGRCAEVCQFHAVVVVGAKVLVFPELCHGCGSCVYQCPEAAIKEEPRVIGCLEGGCAKGAIDFRHGRLNIGEPMAVPVIRALKHWEPPLSDQIVIRDAPPGTSCPVVETMRGSDYVLLVTEPTPFGLHDLKLAVELTHTLGLPAGVVLNRDGLGDLHVEEYCMQAGLPILMRIPLDERIGRALAQGALLVRAFPAYEPQFRETYEQIQACVNPRSSQSQSLKVRS